MDRRRHFQNPATFYTEDMKSEGTKPKNFVKSIYSVIDFTEFLLESWHSVKYAKFSPTFFREIGCLIKNVAFTKFCQKCVRVNFRNFHSVH